MSRPLSPSRVRPFVEETTIPKLEKEQRVLKSMRRAYKKQGLLTEPSIDECYEHGMYYRSPYSRKGYVREYRYLGYDVEVPETKVKATCVKFPELKANDFRRTTLPQLLRNNPHMRVTEAMKFISAVLKYRNGTFSPDRDTLPLRPGVNINYQNVLLNDQPITDVEYNAVTRRLSNQSEIVRLQSPKKTSAVRSTVSPPLPPLPPPPPSTTPTSVTPKLPLLPPLPSRTSPLQSPRSLQERGVRSAQL